MGRDLRTRAAGRADQPELQCAPHWPADMQPFPAHRLLAAAGPLRGIVPGEGTGHARCVRMHGVLIFENVPGMDLRDLDTQPQLRVEIALARLCLARLGLQLAADLRRREYPNRLALMRESQRMDHQRLEPRIQRHIDLGGAVEELRPGHAQHGMFVAVIALGSDADLPIVQQHPGGGQGLRGRGGRAQHPCLARRNAPVACGAVGRRVCQLRYQYCKQATQ